MNYCSAQWYQHLMNYATHNTTHKHINSHMVKEITDRSVTSNTSGFCITSWLTDSKISTRLLFNDTH